MGVLGMCVVALAFAFVGSMPLAGPIAVLTLSRAATRRFDEALRIGLGAAVAEAVYAGVAFWGFATFLARRPLLVPISQGATGVLLIALGTSFLWWRPTKRADPRENKAGTALLGFSISALNPTLLLTWTAAVAFLYARGAQRHSAIFAIPFGLSAGAGVAAWFGCLVKLLRTFGTKLPLAAFRWVIRTMGVALVAIGIALTVKLVRWIAAPAADHERVSSSAAARSVPVMRASAEAFLSWPASRRR